MKEGIVRSETGNEGKEEEGNRLFINLRLKKKKKFLFFKSLLVTAT